MRERNYSDLNIFSIFQANELFVPYFISRLARLNNLLAVPLVAVIGIPIYIRAETMIPIGLVIIEKGMSLEAVLALIIGGAEAVFQS